jgi:hypothetical protein
MVITCLSDEDDIALGEFLFISDMVALFVWSGWAWVAKILLSCCIVWAFWRVRYHDTIVFIALASRSESLEYTLALLGALEKHLAFQLCILQGLLLVAQCLAVGITLWHQGATSVTDIISRSKWTSCFHHYFLTPGVFTGYRLSFTFLK